MLWNNTTIKYNLGGEGGRATCHPSLLQIYKNTQIRLAISLKLAKIRISIRHLYWYLWKLQMLPNIFSFNI